MNDLNTTESRRSFIRSSGAAVGLAAIAGAFSENTAQGADAAELNAMLPTPEQSEAFLALPDKPVVMVNLLKFKDAGEYQKYGMKVSKILKTIGAEIIISGECKTTLIGGAQWDAFALVRYPSAKAATKMFASEEYQAAHVHRAAGLEGQLLIAVFENELGASEGVTAEQIMSRLDTNKDGKIDQDEAPDQLKNSFAIVDANGDGVIDLEEAQTIADFVNNQ